PGALPLDRVPARAADGHGAGRISVVELAVVVNVRQAVPLRRALERHDHEVVGELCVPDAGIDPEHQVDGVEATSLPDLRTVGAERQAQTENDAAPDGRGSAANHLGRDEVDRAALVAGSPASPVGDLARERLQSLMHFEPARNRMDVRSSRSNSIDTTGGTPGPGALVAPVSATWHRSPGG